MGLEFVSENVTLKYEKKKKNKWCKTSFLGNIYRTYKDDFILEREICVGCSWTFKSLAFLGVGLDREKGSFVKGLNYSKR